LLVGKSRTQLLQTIDDTMNNNDINERNNYAVGGTTGDWAASTQTTNARAATASNDTSRQNQMLLARSEISQGALIQDYQDHSLEPIDANICVAPAHRRPNFPESLFAILSNEALTDTIAWMPHGRSFTILNQDRFASSVLPKYYRHANTSSFVR
jgi:hypothetical protein